jgi:hypothetical protein
MTKAKGRVAREKGLPEIQGRQPEGDLEWSPPSDLVRDEYVVELDDDNRLIIRLALDGSQVAEFCLLHQTRASGGWKDVVRYDCAHGTVHGHYFRPDGTEMRQRTVRNIADYADIRAGYDESYKAIFTRWEENLRGF